MMTSYDEIQGSLAAEVFESLGEFENGIIAAETDCRVLATHPIVLIEANASRGCCLAKLGRTTEAEESFMAAIEVAVVFQVPFWEMVVRSDLVVFVLDAQGRREEQMAALGGAISCMVLPPAEYTQVLGSGIDAEAAVAAFVGGS